VVNQALLLSHDLRSLPHVDGAGGFATLDGSDLVIFHNWFYQAVAVLLLQELGLSDWVPTVLDDHALRCLPKETAIVRLRCLTPILRLPFAKRGLLVMVTGSSRSAPELRFLRFSHL